MTDLTRILEAAKRGEPQAESTLLPLVYEELKRLAAARMARENPGHTLAATALVHEAYLKLVGQGDYANQQHFFRVAAEAMRQILVDRARKKKRVRHGGGKRRVGLSNVASLAETADDDVLALHEALEGFAAQDPDKAELVKLRYFGGLTEQETADALGISRATASRHWKFARAWLVQAMEEG